MIVSTEAPLKVSHQHAKSGRHEHCGSRDDKTT